MLKAELARSVTVKAELAGTLRNHFSTCRRKNYGSRKRTFAPESLSVTVPSKIPRVGKVGDNQHFSSGNNSSDECIEECDYQLFVSNCEQNFRSRHLLRNRFGTDILRQKLIKKFEMNPSEVLLANSVTQREFKELYDAMGNGAKKRVDEMLEKGYFTFHGRFVRTLSIILSLQKQIMVNLTAPLKKRGLIWSLDVEFCGFDTNHLRMDQVSKKYNHFSAKFN